ncbi:MAG: alpha-mannosidase [Opitutaceae bacterium]|jgi:alpha-mannosidase|nr:alpha-mannosidase [Opitutaceae bacterium]
MLPRTFLTHLIPARIAEATRRLQARIWQPLPDEAAGIAVAATPVFREFREASSLKASEFKPVPAGPWNWGPKFAQRWFKVTLPPSSLAAPKSDKRTRYLVWNDQAEATAYINGVPYSGLDVAHPYTPLPTSVGARELLVESICIRSGIALSGEAAPLDQDGSRYAAPGLALRDDDAWHAYHDLTVLLDLLECEHRDYQPLVGQVKRFTDPIRFTAPAFRASPLFRRLCVRLDEAIDILDRDGIPSLRKTLQRIYADFPAEPGAMKAVLTGHAHIDLVWLWPERIGERKAVHSWSTQARLLKEYPEFRFGYSQPASYDAVKRISPALHTRVKSLIKDGRWDATGASYVECDTQIPCGEALLRSLRLGQQGFTDLRGNPAKVFWLPDVFGYSGCMPQLLRGLGVEGFFTSKLSWSTVNRFPHTSFRWRGPDGAEITSHIVLLHDYNEAVNLKNIREDAFHHQQAGVHDEFLQPTGYGDGGGGPTEAMLERARRVNNLAGVPQTQWGNIEPFFERLHAIREKLPAVTGELILELHRGVFTTHGSLKTAFRGIERALQIQEAAHAVTGAGPIDDHAWRRATFSHFHDYIPGSSIWEVYHEAIPELEKLSAGAITAAITTLSKKTGTPKKTATKATGIFNPLPVARNYVEHDRCYRLAPLSGAPLDEMVVADVPAPKATATTLASDRVAASFDKVGRVVKLSVDGRDVALSPPPLAAGLNTQLAAYPDHPAAFEAWDVDRTSLVAGQPAKITGKPEVRTAGLTAAVSFNYTVAGKSAVRITYSVTSGEPVLRVAYDIDWQDPRMWLKAIFATRYRGREARFGAPFGSALRGQWPGYPREEANWELPGSRWMALMDDAQNEGLALVTESKYGFTVHDGTVGVSLLRSALVTEADHHPKIRETKRPHYSDLGEQHVELALGLFSAAAPAAEQPAILADTLYTPAIPYTGAAVSAGLLGVEGAPSLAPSWAEPVEGGWVLRLHETLGRHGTARVRLAEGWKAEPVALDGASLGLPQAGGIDLPFTQYKVLSVRISR